MRMCVYVVAFASTFDIYIHIYVCIYYMFIRMAYMNVYPYTFYQYK